MESLSDLSSVVQGSQGRALAVSTEEGPSVVHDAGVIVLDTVVVDLALVQLLEVVPHRVLKGRWYREVVRGCGIEVVQSANRVV